MFGKPKKLKRIPSDLVSYIQIETESISDANDKMMISSYCLSKLDITEKLSELKDSGNTTTKGDIPEINDLKLRIKAIEKEEQQLVDMMLSGQLGDALLELVNHKAASLKKSKQELHERIDTLKMNAAETSSIVNLAKSWRNADYDRKKAVAMIMIQKIIISEDGSVKIIWNI